MKSLSIILFFSLLNTSFFAQDKWIDSVKQEIAKSKIDSSKVKLYLSIQKQYVNTNFDLAKAYNQKAELLSKKIKFEFGLAKTAYNFGEINYTEGKYKLLHQYANESFKMHKKLKMFLGAAMCLNLRAKGFWAEGKFNDAQAMLFKCVKYCRVHNELDELGYTYNMLGILNSEQKRLKQALVYFEESKQIRLKLNDKLQLGSVYLNMASVYVDLKLYNKAVLNYNKALESHKKNNYPGGVIIASVALADCYNQMKKFVEAEKILKKCFANGKENLSIDNIEMISVTLGVALLNQGKISEAKPYLFEALRISKEIGDQYEVMICYDNLADLYEREKQFDQAFLYKSMHQDLKDSIANTETKIQFEELEVKYETEKKDAEIKKKSAALLFEKQQASRNFWIALMLILLIAAIFLLIFNRFKLKKKQEKQDLEQLSTLKIIQSEQNERMRIARELHDGIGQKLSVLKMFSSSDTEQALKQKKLVEETIAEVREISHNLMPEILNLGLYRTFNQLIRDMNESSVKANFIASETLAEMRLSPDVELSVYRIVQEIISNMLKHANATVIQLKMIKENSSLKIQIADDGIGFDTSKIYKSSGIGWSNVITRTKIIQAQFNILSSNKGTQVDLTINI